LQKPEYCYANVCGDVCIKHVIQHAVIIDIEKVIGCAVIEKVIGKVIGCAVIKKVIEMVIGYYG